MTRTLQVQSASSSDSSPRPVVGARNVGCEPDLIGDVARCLDLYRTPSNADLHASNLRNNGETPADKRCALIGQTIYEVVKLPGAEHAHIVPAPVVPYN